MTGRPRKPDSLKKFQGTLKKSRINTTQPRPALTIPKAAIKLSRKAAAYRKNIATKLHELGVLAETDGDILDRYCQAWDMAEKIHEEIDTTGLMTKTEAGGLVKNPLLATYVQLLQQLKAYAVELGLTPVARTRINVTKNEQKEENPFTKLIQIK